MTKLKKNIQFPKWSHNGDSIAFLASSEDNINDNIYIYSLLTQKISALNTPFERHNRPSWTLDDKKIISAIYTGEFTDLFSITIADSVTERLTKDNARYGIMTSATKLLYSKINNGLWQVDLADKHKKPKKVINSKEFTRSYAWDYHDNGIYFNKELKDHHRIMFYDLTLGQTRPLLKLPLNSFDRENMINYIPGEDSIMFTKSSYPQANIKMLMNSSLLQ